MGRELTAFIIADKTVMWESIDSCRSCTDNVVVCDVGMDSKSRRLVDDYRSFKEGVSLVGYETIEEVCVNIPRECWNIILFGNEVIHEDCYQFLWDIAVNHDECDSVAVQVADFKSGTISGVIDDTRMFSGVSSMYMKYDGKGFSSTYKGKSAIPAELCPKPIWRFSLGDLAVSEETVRNLVPCMPKATRRLAFRSSYVEPYMMRSSG